MNQSELMELCATVMGSAENADAWMATPALALDGRRPADLLDSQDGRAEVEVLLTQIEHGVYI